MTEEPSMTKDTLATLLREAGDYLRSGITAYNYRMNLIDRIDRALVGEPTQQGRWLIERGMPVEYLEIYRYGAGYWTGDIAKAWKSLKFTTQAAALEFVDATALRVFRGIRVRQYSSIGAAKVAPRGAISGVKFLNVTCTCWAWVKNGEPEWHWPDCACVPEPAQGLFEDTFTDEMLLKLVSCGRPDTARLARELQQWRACYKAREFPCDAECKLKNIKHHHYVGIISAASPTELVLMKEST